MADAKVRSGRVLDIGCGDGLLLQRLALFAQHVVGIDRLHGGMQNPKVRIADPKESMKYGISSLAKASNQLVEKNVQRLKADLASGIFYEKYGGIKNLIEYDCGYFFLAGDPDEMIYMLVNIRTSFR